MLSCVRQASAWHRTLVQQPARATPLSFHSARVYTRAHLIKTADVYETPIGAADATSLPPFTPHSYGVLNHHPFICLAFLIILVMLIIMVIIALHCLGILTTVMYIRMYVYAQ